MQREIASQPDCWARAMQSAGQAAMVLPARGERVAVIGCGTSWHIASAIATARETAGHGETDAFTASELPARDYDAVLAVTRSGTTAEVLDALRNLRGRARRIGITADAATPISEVTDQLLVLDYADEQSVVQTRFATTVLTLGRAIIGHDLVPVIEQAIDTAALMLGTDKSRGYCLEMICADFLAGANLDSGQPDVLLSSMARFFQFLPDEQRRTFVEEIGEKSS